MKYKIAFFTEGNFEGKVPRTHPNMRTDLAWQAALESYHYNYNHPHYRPLGGGYDIGIMIVPKTKPELAFDNFTRIKGSCRKVIVMQEGPRHYWEDYGVELQVRYLNLLRDVDAILCHNGDDVAYFKGLSNGNKVDVMQTLIIEDALPILIENRKKNGVMIGGNMCSWYGGMVSYIVASNFEVEVFAPSMGRRVEREEELDIFHLPYMNWKDWMSALAGMKYAVHLMPTKAAGSFALNCARLGIPCIGYRGIDTQHFCFPKLSVRDGDVNQANELALRLKEDEEFREDVIEEAKQSYKFFKEEHFLGKMNIIFDDIYR